MISSATKTLQTNNKTIYVAILSTLTFFLFLDYIPGLQAWSAWVTPPVALFLGLIFALTCGQAHPKDVYKRQALKNVIYLWKLIKNIYFCSSIITVLI